MAPSRGRRMQECVGRLPAWVERPRRQPAYGGFPGGPGTAECGARGRHAMARMPSGGPWRFGPDAAHEMRPPGGPVKTCPGWITLRVLDAAA